MNQIRKTLAPDWWLFVLVLVLLSLGLMLVYDASYPYSLDRTGGALERSALALEKSVERLNREGIAPGRRARAVRQASKAFSRTVAAMTIPDPALQNRAASLRRLVEKNKSDGAIVAARPAFLKVSSGLGELAHVYLADLVAQGKPAPGDGFLFLRKQVWAALIGLGLMFLLMNLKYWQVSKLAVPGFIASLVLLALTLKFAPERLGARRWLDFGPVQVQPSELTKLAMVLFLAQMLATRRWIVKNLWSGVVVLFVACAVPMVIVERQPDLGTAVTILIIVLAMLFAAGAKGRWVVSIAAFCALLAFGAAARGGFDSYRWQRIITFTNPDANKEGTGYQIHHSTIALGTGGVSGVGVGESREKLPGALPERHTDFIFSILGEETGLLGTCGVLLLYVLFALRGFSIACDSRDPLGQLLATGITTMVVGQALVNIAVVTASIPATGVPLPFLSYGGSALVTNLAAMGILLNVSRHPYRGSKRPTKNERRPADEFLHRIGMS